MGKINGGNFFYKFETPISLSMSPLQTALKLLSYDRKSISAI